MLSLVGHVFSISDLGRMLLDMQYQQRQKLRLGGLIAISVALHGWLIVSIVIERPVPKLSEADSVVLELSIRSPTPPEQPPVEREEDPVQAPELEPEVEQKKAHRSEPAQPQVAEALPKGSPPLPSVLELRRSLAATMGVDKAYQGPSCTPAERANEIRRCEPEEDMRDRRQAFYAGLFREAFGHIGQANPSFSKDMDRVAALAAKSESLTALDPDNPVEASLLREQRAYLQQEISRIDQRYAEFNLFKLIPIGKRVVKGLEEKLGER